MLDKYQEIIDHLKEAEHLKLNAFLDKLKAGTLENEKADIIVQYKKELKKVQDKRQECQMEMKCLGYMTDIWEKAIRNLEGRM